MSSPIHCPVHGRAYCFYDAPPFIHNIRVKPEDATERSPGVGYGFVYKISHVESGRCYVGRTKKRLSERWALHRSARRSERRKDESLYRAMNEDGIHMFLMEELEECALAIIQNRELDYMRELQSWNPERGYNSPTLAMTYARRLYFSRHPSEEKKYKLLCEGPKLLVNGWWEPVPPDERWICDLREILETSLLEGRKLMLDIPFLTRPVILTTLPDSE